MPSSTTIQLTRHVDAADFARFVTELGLNARRYEMSVELLEPPDTMEVAVTSWLAQSPRPLVPTARLDGSVCLHPPTA